MTAPVTSRRVGHPGTHPWESLPSIRANLPRSRAEWLALVLPVIDRSGSHPEVERELTALGYKVHRAVIAWHAKLEALRVAGELPEHPGAFPERKAGWREGMPLPTTEQSAEGGRKAMVTRWGKVKGKARKGPGKPGKSRVKG